MNNTTTNRATTGREIYCGRCSVAPVAAEGLRCETCEARFVAERDAALAKHGYTPGTAPTEPVSANDWLDDLKDERDGRVAAGVQPSPVAFIPNDIPMIENSLAQARENTGEAAKKVAAELVPEFGNGLTRIDPTALAFGFPPAVDTLIKKAQLTPEQTSHLLIQFKDLFLLTTEMRSRVAAVDPRSVNDTEAIAEAKELHLTLRNERINAEKRKKIVKEPYLRPSQLIDGVFRIWMDEINPIEVEAKAKAEYVENLERERKAALAEERAGKLALFEVTDTSFNLGEISDEAFDVIYQGAMSSYQARKAEEQRVARERADQLAAYEAEQERLRAENERLIKERAEADAREAVAREREAIERKAKEDAEAEIRRQDELRLAEQHRVAAEAETRRTAPDREKLLAFAQDLELVIVPDVDAKFAGFVSEIELRQRSLIEFIRKNVDTV